MFHEVGAFDAKAKLSELLRSVREGQCFTITVRGEAVADLVPTGTTVRREPEAAVAAMRDFKKIKGVSNAEVSELIRTGRR
jgi:prevent-host-death family protein